MTPVVEKTPEEMKQCCAELQAWITKWGALPTVSCRETGFVAGQWRVSLDPRPRALSPIAVTAWRTVTVSADDNVAEKEAT